MSYFIIIFSNCLQAAANCNGHHQGEPKKTLKVERLEMAVQFICNLRKELEGCGFSRQMLKLNGELALTLILGKKVMEEKPYPAVQSFPQLN